jgi:hypothetical protein
MANRTKLMLIKIHGVVRNQERKTEKLEFARSGKYPWQKN